MSFAPTWMEVETLALSKVKSERQIPQDITDIQNLTYHTNELFHRKENHGLGEQIVVAKGEGVGWSLGFIDANYCLWNGLAMRSCCVALGTVQSLTMEHEKWMYTCMCNWATIAVKKEKK